MEEEEGRPLRGRRRHHAFTMTWDLESRVRTALKDTLAPPSLFSPCLDFVGGNGLRARASPADGAQGHAGSGASHHGGAPPGHPHGLLARVLRHGHADRAPARVLGQHGDAGEGFLRAWGLRAGTRRGQRGLVPSHGTEGAKQARVLGWRGRARASRRTRLSRSPVLARLCFCACAGGGGAGPGAPGGRPLPRLGAPLPDLHGAPFPSAHCTGAVRHRPPARRRRRRRTALVPQLCTIRAGVRGAAACPAPRCGRERRRSTKRQGGQ